MNAPSSESAGLIVFIEDDPDQLAVVARWMTAEKFEVEEFRNAEAAIAALAAIARHLLGDELGDQLALEHSRAWGQVTSALPLLGHALRRVERLPITRGPLERAGERVARVLSERGFDPAP